MLPLSGFFWKALFKIRAQPLTAHDASLCHKYEHAGVNLFTLLAKRGHLHLQTQKLALRLVVITQEAEAHSDTHSLIVLSHLQC